VKVQSVCDDKMISLAVSAFSQGKGSQGCNGPAATHKEIFTEIRKLNLIIPWERWGECLHTYVCMYAHM